MEILNSQLEIPEKYMELSDGKICATVHRNWLANLWTVGPVQFLTHDRLSMDEIAARPSLEDLGPNWTRIYIRVSVSSSHTVSSMIHSLLINQKSRFYRFMRNRTTMPSPCQGTDIPSVPKYNQS